MTQRVLPIVLIFLAVAIGYFYIYATYTGDITTEQQQITSYNNALSAAASFSQKENNLLAQRTAMDPTDLTRLQDYMPDGVDNIQLILDMDTLASRYGVSLSGFSIQNNAANASGSTSGSNPTPTTPAAGTPLQSPSSTNSLDLSVSATGTYQAFQAFLTAAELSLRPLDITHLTLTSSATGVYTYAITFRIYWLP